MAGTGDARHRKETRWAFAAGWVSPKIRELSDSLSLWSSGNGLTAVGTATGDPLLITRHSTRLSLQCGAFLSFTWQAAIMTRCLPELGRQSSFLDITSFGHVAPENCVRRRRSILECSGPSILGRLSIIRCIGIMTSSRAWSCYLG